MVSTSITHEPRRNGTAPPHLHVKPLSPFSGEVSEHCITFKVFLLESWICLHSLQGAHHFFTQILHWQVSTARPWTRREHTNNRCVSLLLVWKCKHWHVHTKPSTCSCCGLEHRAPFQNSIVISPQMDKVLSVHMHVWLCKTRSNLRRRGKCQQSYKKSTELDSIQHHFTRATQFLVQVTTQSLSCWFPTRRKRVSSSPEETKHTSSSH